MLVVGAQARDEPGLCLLAAPALLLWCVLHSRLEGCLCVVRKVILNLLTQEALILVLKDLHSTAECLSWCQR